jgi:hypothetical protein
MLKRLGEKNKDLLNLELEVTWSKDKDGVISEAMTKSSGFSGGEK